MSLGFKRLRHYSPAQTDSALSVTPFCY